MGFLHSWTIVFLVFCILRQYTSSPTVDSTTTEEQQDVTSFSTVSEQPDFTTIIPEITTKDASSDLIVVEQQEEEEHVEDKVRYDGDQVLYVFTVNSKQRKKIKELEEKSVVERLQTNTTSVHLLIKKDNLVEVKQSLTNASMTFGVLVNDLQRSIDEENPPITDEELDEFLSRKGHRMTFEHYHRMVDVHGFLDYLAATRSDFVSVIPIGKSVEGRPLKVIRILSGKPNANAMWIDGGTHAREWITVSTVSYIINELVENRDSLEKEVRETDFYILPLINPDGYEYSHMRERLWRKNRQKNYGAICTGVDLNRNWGYEWGGQGAGKYPCQETYAGTSPLSEPESKAISAYILENAKQIKASCTLHSYGQYILYPWGYSKRVPPDHNDLDRVGRATAAAMKQAGGSTYTVGNSAALLYAASGGFDDWAKGVAKIKYSYTIELRDTGRHGFVLPANHIVPTGKEAFAAIKAIAKEINT